MDKENYGLNSESMLSAAQGAGRVSTQASDAGSSMSGKFSGMNKLNGKAVGEISKQTSLLGDAIGSWQNIITTNVNKGLDYDNRMAEVAEDIEIPLDYTTNNSMDINTYNSIYISKTDDKSVNEGEDAQKTGDLDETTVAAENIFDMSKNKTQQENYDDTTIIGESILGNINKDQTQKQEYDDDTSVGNKKLKDISGDQTQKQEYDSSSGVEEENLKNINKDETQQQTYDDSSNVRGKIISDISGNQTQQQTYDSSTVIGNSILGSISSNSSTRQQVFDDDAIAASVSNGPSAEVKEVKTNETEKVTDESVDEAFERVKQEEQKKDEQVA